MNDSKLEDAFMSARTHEDAPLREKRPMREVSTWIQYYFRKAAFMNVPLRKVLGRFVTPKTGAYWDTQMSTTAMSTYLGGTLEIDWRNALVAVLIKHYASAQPAVLDIGCAGGSLALMLPQFKSYLGVDISKYAIGLARQNPAFAESIANGTVNFITAEMCDLLLDANPTWDVIVFNEVLYYLNIEAAVSQVDRYVKVLRPRGIVCISMKDDPKAHAIYRELMRRYDWRDGILWQRKAVRPDYRVRIDSARRGFLMAAMQARSND